MCSSDLTLFFTGDTNTGLYSPGADQVALTTGGTGRLFINSSGLVGIGTSSVQSLLHVEGTQSATWSTNDSGTYSTAPYSTELAVFNQQTATTNSFASIFFQGGKNSAGAGYHCARFGVINDGTTYGGAIAFANRNGSTGNMIEAMRIDSSQRVGIGSTAPSATLHVVGTTANEYFRFVGNSTDRKSTRLNSSHSSVSRMPSSA